MDNNTTDTCYICHNTCTNPQQFNHTILVKAWYPEKLGFCDHTFCEECLRNWLVACLTEGNDFSCPTCRAVYISQYHLTHFYNLYVCFKEYRNRN